MKFGLNFGFSKKGASGPPPPLSALCPGDLTIPDSIQPSVDAVFAAWLAGFGINEPGCVPSVSNLVSTPPGFNPPTTGAGLQVVTVVNTVTDDCGQEDICQSIFTMQAP